MKKILSFCLSIALVVSLAACSNETTGGEESLNGENEAGSEFFDFAEAELIGKTYDEVLTALGLEEGDLTYVEKSRGWYTFPDSVSYGGVEFTKMLAFDAVDLDSDSETLWCLSYKYSAGDDGATDEEMTELVRNVYSELEDRFEKEDTSEENSKIKKALDAGTLEDTGSMMETFSASDGSENWISVAVTRYPPVFELEVQYRVPPDLNRNIE